MNHYTKNASLRRNSAAVPQPVRVAVRRKLLRWYDRNKRDLPWRRRARDPYAQWVAEVMLQQTRVETVIQYYERFLDCFGTVDALAGADHDKVLKQWEGLGYYRRALQLHRAAKLVHESGLGLPSTTDQLKKLPGIGEYTAAAIASIAFNRREAAVDGNVARVLARLFAVRDDVLSTQGKARIGDLAVALLPLKRPGDFNQAWMDLGSAICTSANPTCTECPLGSLCVAFSTNQTAVLPIRNGRQKRTNVSILVGVFVRHGRMLLCRRPTGGLWSGLWEFPNMEPRAAGLSPRELRIALQRLAEQEGVTIDGEPRKAGTVRRQLTHRALTFEIYIAQVEPVGRGKLGINRRWATPKALSNLALSTAHRHILSVARTKLRTM